MAEKEIETDNGSRFGWCMDAHHETCIAWFFSDQTKKNYQCSCTCHKGKSGPG